MEELSIILGIVILLTAIGLGEFILSLIRKMFKNHPFWGKVGLFEKITPNDEIRKKLKIPSEWR